ncbi:MAG TPA: DUF4329 domain-containing protein, partial [Beijerinckiaceae bacterium]|nr:DUF4329 domain-containing protein [Beijerinckiaceae bacterium]
HPSLMSGDAAARSPVETANGQTPAGSSGDTIAHLIVDLIKRQKELIERLYPQTPQGPGGVPGTTPRPPKRGPYPTPEAAARAALREANPRSVAENREYAGLIYRGADGQYYYTGPVAGTPTSSRPNDAPAPAGSTVVGDYHTHGDYSTTDPATGQSIPTDNPAEDQYNSDHFSGTDKKAIGESAADNPGYKGYLGTPSGGFKQYDPATGKETAL